MIDEMLADADHRMKTSVELVRRELASLRTGRASLAILDGIKVDYYGTPTPLGQVGNLGVPDPTLITIQPWDPTTLPIIEKAIRGSDLAPSGTALGTSCSAISRRSSCSTETNARKPISPLPTCHATSSSSGSSSVCSAGRSAIRIRSTSRRQS